MSSSEESVSEAEVEVEVSTSAPPTAAEEEEYRLNPDPYLLADAAYIQKDSRWKNKQRVLVFCTRGVDGRHRHLLEDLKKMLPHHKAEPKFEKKDSFTEINEIMELKSCNSCVFLETRKHAKHAYLHMARTPHGPTFKFHVQNLHTSGEVNLSGNCLMGSRPLLVFDAAFDSAEQPHLRLMKEMFMQIFGTPRNHPKSKPFHDHVMSFYYLDNKVWFRHHQISPETPDNKDDPEHQSLTEIGPRFVLEPMHILAGSFGGKKIWQSTTYVSPIAARRRLREEKADATRRRQGVTAKRQKHEAACELEADPLEDAFEE